MVCHPDFYFHLAAELNKPDDESAEFRWNQAKVGASESFAI